MTNAELENRLRLLSRQERSITGEILELIREAQIRKIYLERGYGSLFDWLVSEFHYSQPAAYRRILAARLIGAVPDAAVKLEEGKLNLSILVEAQRTITKEEKRSGIECPPEQKESIVSALEGKSLESAQKILGEVFPDVADHRESLRPINNEEFRLNIVILRETAIALNRVKEVLSHSVAGGTWAELFDFVLKDFLKRKDPLQQLTQRVTAATNHRVISASLRRQILQRSQGQCEFQHPDTDQRCSSRHQIEIDHIIPKALGGGNEAANLRALCRAHNLYEAERVLGAHSSAAP